MKILNYKRKIAAGLILAFSVSCTHYVYIARSPWQKTAVAADGKPTEWSIPLKYYDEKSKLQFAVTNDFENLYFCIKATEEQTQAKILRAGLQIWIDTTGKDQNRAGILFPLSSALRRTDQNQPAKERSIGENKEERNSGKKQDVSGYRKKFLNEYKEMELSGFKPPINGMNPIQNSYGIAVNINWDSSGIMTYEAVVPFKTFFKDVLSASDSLKLLGFSIVLNALPMPEGHSGGGGGGHGGGGGGGGMGGGGMGGAGMGGGGMRGGGGGHGGGGHGGGGGASQGSQYLYEKNTIKKTFQLAVKIK